jgi:hypothetical protein
MIKQPEVRDVYNDIRLFEIAAIFSSWNSSREKMNHFNKQKKIPFFLFQWQTNSFN